jgi:hypothetical protein
MPCSFYGMLTGFVLPDEKSPGEALTGAMTDVYRHLIRALLLIMDQRIHTPGLTGYRRSAVGDIDVVTILFAGIDLGRAEDTIIR